MPPAITREERLTFYRMLLQQVDAPEPYHVTEIDDMLVGNIVGLLHATPPLKSEFIRLTRVKGQSNSLLHRIQRMIHDVYNG